SGPPFSRGISLTSRPPQPAWPAKYEGRRVASMPPRDVTGVAQAVRARTPVTDGNDPEIAAEGRAAGPRITMGPIARGMLVVLLLYALARALRLVRDALFM